MKGIHQTAFVFRLLPGSGRGWLGDLLHLPFEKDAQCQEANHGGKDEDRKNQRPEPAEELKAQFYKVMKHDRNL
jgi:hypothetical protein